MKLSIWPFRQLHLTNDGESAGWDSPHRKLSGEGILTNRSLAAFQSEICHALDRATTLVEFSRSGDAIKTDSHFLQFRIHRACRRLRELDVDESTGVQGRLCELSDGAHAQFFRRVWPLHPVTADGLCVGCGSKDLYSGAPECERSVVSIRDRTVLSYDCPLLGFREALFPVVVEGRMLAGFFLGQIVLQEKLDFIRARQASLLERVPDIFSAYRRRSSSDIGPEQLLRTVRDAFDQERRENQAAVSSAAYEGLLERGCVEIEKFEERLSEEMAHQRSNYVALKVGARLDAFRHALPEQPRHGRPALAELWHNVEAAQAGIVNDFGLEYAVVLGVTSPSPRPQVILDIVARAGRVPLELQPPAEWPVRLDLRKLPRDASRVTIYHLGRDEEVLNGCLINARPRDFKDALLVVVDVPLHPQSSIAILVGYRDDNPSSATHNEPAGELDRALQAFNTLVVSSLSAILAATSERDIEDRLRVLRHEAGQLTAGIDAIRQVYLSTPDGLLSLSPKKATDICGDLDGYLRQMHSLLALIKYSVDDLPRLEPTRFWPFKELLFKWRDTYRLEAKKKRLEFCLPLVTPGDPDRPEIEADRNLLEQLLYNLVSNAVKCAHRGTRVYLDFSRQKSEAGPWYRLGITDFGVEMPAHDRVYDLYVRGDNAPPEGLGIGLWLAKKIVAAHGGSIHHRVERISDFNIPCIAPYILAHTDFPSVALRRQLVRERDRLLASGTMSAVLATAPGGEALYRPLKATARKEIAQATFKVTVYADLPAGQRRTQS